MRGWGAIGIALLVVAATTGGGAGATPAAGPVPAPTLSAPPAGIHGYPLWDSWFDLAPFGYEEQEYLVSGTAHDAGGTAQPYTTRIIVTRPTDPSHFNGTVLLDWVNVTAQFENAVDSIEASQMLLREGFTVVHMSAQKAGLCCVPLTPKIWDPVRYAALSHPGDGFSFDMVTQIAEAFRNPAVGPDPMGGIGSSAVQHVLAAGQSQSALRLRDYVDDWLPAHPTSVGVIDGVLIHGDLGAAKPFHHPLPIKVLNLLSDEEAQDDGFDPAKADPDYRLWEVAGTAHSDLWIGHQSVFGQGPRVLATAAKQTPTQYAATVLAAGNYGEQLSPELLTCVVAGAAMPMHYATSSAIHQLARWVDGGAAPDNGPRFQFEGGKQAKDAVGNAKGGVRLPPIDVPVATYESTACQLGGLTVPMTDLALAQRYGTHAAYYALMAKATDKAVAEGWILPDDAVDLMQRACAAKNRFPDNDDHCPLYDPPAYDTVAPTITPPTTVAPPTTAPPAVSADDHLPATGGNEPWPAALAAITAALVLATARRRA